LYLVVDDPEAGGDGLVELSAYVWRGAQVEPVRISAEHDGDQWYLPSVDQ
jgi:hypothetical protein